MKGFIVLLVIGGLAVAAYMFFMRGPSEKEQAGVAALFAGAFCQGSLEQFAPSKLFSEQGKRDLKGGIESFYRYLAKQSLKLEDANTMAALAKKAKAAGSEMEEFVVAIGQEMATQCSYEAREQQKISTATAMMLGLLSRFGSGERIKRKVESYN